jgi:calcineurin-binding protein cabin-1
VDCLLQGKAIRHYLLDVCVNPVRIDSWAGMALARGSQLETKLNSVSTIFTVGVT